jgi:DNA integrity scanning protein DisA with diadenylate cyclase activity
MSVELIVQAVFQLTKTKTGALIVLQNRDSVEPYIREGFALDGRFNLVTSFWQQTSCRYRPQRGK